MAAKSLFLLGFIGCSSLTFAAEGGSSISGMAVRCFDQMEQCAAECTTKGFTCFMADHCNDGNHAQVACAPNVTLMVLLTFLCIVSATTCCCAICFCSPCCFCAVWLKKRRERATNQGYVVGKVTDA